jgi:chromodomain-helicase-DNA-binding protein 4
MRLKNGPQAIREFIDGSQSPDPLAMDFDSGSHLGHAGGDAASDYDQDMDWGTRAIGIARDRQRRRGTSEISYAHFFSSDQPDERVDERNSNEEISSDEEEESSDELSKDDVRPNTRRHLKRGAQKRRRQTHGSSEESFASDTGKRTSSRLKQTRRRNLKERLEDDEYSEVEVEVPKQKFSGAKEQFRELPIDDEFRASHSEKCFKCGLWEDENPKQGLLVFCQGCSSSYHQGCLGDRSTRNHLVTKVDAGDFILQCLNCLGTRHQTHDILPHLGHCATCNEAGSMSQPLRDSYTSQEEQQLREQNGGTDPVTNVDMSRVNNIDNVLIRCTCCKRGFHIKHLMPNSEEDRSSIHTETWQCHDCSDAPAVEQPIQVIVTWRPKDPTVEVVPRLVEMLPEIDKEYLIKWTQQSYFRVTWKSGDWVWCIAHSAMFKAFYKSDKSNKPIMTTEQAVPEENLRVDIIFDVEYIRKPKSPEERADPKLVKRAYIKFQGLPYEDTVWENPPSQTDTARWQDFKDALVDRVRGESIQPPERKDLRNRLEDARKKRFDKALILSSQPRLVTGGELMEYQMDGVNWLYYMFFRKTNAILADDMGLGKTVQIITFLAALIENIECFPFLVVVPNSTVPNWRREIKGWAPNIRVVTYYGSAWARGMAEKHEMFHNGRLSCHVVIASYESMADEDAKRVLSKIPWAGLVVDEGQRLKNDQTVLYDRLRRMRFEFKVLLTGTPLQNNIRELFNLIQFLDPANDAEKLEAKYGGPLAKDDIRELHDMIRPCFLRRTKAEVLPFLPPMVQIIIPISMSVVQKRLYKSILEKNPKLIHAIMKKKAGSMRQKDRANLNNILIQLRKCLCHPFIYNRDIEEQTFDHQLAHQRLIEASGKLRLLNLMLPRLQERGHRVLIFSQFLENLDILEDFLVGIGLRFCRLDGRLSSRDKQKQIDMFNAPDSPFFAFLLSTRSGGVGINLATADTVIIMDPDFNPKQDMQALSRAHRIGQKNTVLVFHLVVRASVEEKIMQKGKTKMALDHVLIDKMEADEDKEDLESILKHGAQALFDDDDSADIKYDRQSIEKLLDRSHAEQAEEIAEEGSSSTKDPGQFNFARVWQMDRGSLEEVTVEEDSQDNSAWERILQDREREAQEELNRQAEGLGRGKRKRAAISYSTKVQAGDDDEERDAATPTKNPANKMRKVLADKDYQEPDDDVNDGDENESDADANIMDMGEDHATLDDEASRQGDIPIVSRALDYCLFFSLVTVLPDEINKKQFTNRHDSTASRAFRRVQSPRPLPQLGTDGATDPYPVCVACRQYHVPGSCPLRLAGVEMCGLCGIAHFGSRRVCPHLQSTVQVQRMLEALEKSVEDPVMIFTAKKYLNGILVSMAHNERRKISAAQAASQLSVTSPSDDAVGRSNFVDLTL